MRIWFQARDGCFLLGFPRYLGCRSIHGWRSFPGCDAAVAWNAVATQAFLPTQGTDPLTQSRTYAMLHAAIHDALNATHQRYEFYTPGMPVMPGASPDAAVAAAAHDVLVALIPTQQLLIQQAYGLRWQEFPTAPPKKEVSSWARRRQPSFWLVDSTTA